MLADAKKAHRWYIVRMRPTFWSISLRSSGTTWLLRFAVASVWLYHGLWNKLLSSAGRHAQIVDAVPEIAGVSADTLRISIGVVEVAIALWVLAGVAPRTVAVVQTVLLVAMNLGGLLWAPDSIPDPGAMIVQNIAFLALVWVVAERERGRRERD
jgi:uncharacterized membrane protein YphA (DoxX/SURF4 family)